MEKEIEQVLACTGGRLLSTCSTKYPVENCVTFVRNPYYLQLLQDTEKVPQLYVVMSWTVSQLADGSPWFIPIIIEDPEWVFSCYHNEYANMKAMPLINIGRGCDIHPTAAIGEKGTRVVQAKDGRRLLLAHIGGLLIGRNVYIGPQSVIHSGTFDPTIVDDEVVIGSLVNIGHNVRIKERSIIASGAVFAGSSTLGKRCFVGCRAMVCPGCVVCDDVKIGAGGLVSKSITKPGNYVGAPVRRVGDWDGRWE